MRVVGDIVRWGARRHPDRLALVIGGTKMTYRQLDLASNRVANALIAAGVETGARVAVFDFNSADYIAIAFGAAKAGATLMPINFRSRPDELAFLVADARPRALIFGKDLAETVWSAAPSFPAGIILYSLGGAVDGAKPLEKIIERASDTVPAMRVDPRVAAALMYTSGTTGTPKGVLFPHTSYFSTYLALIVEGDLDPGTVTMVNIPLFHQAGMHALTMPTLMMGGTVVLTGRSFDPLEALDTVARHRVTTTMWVPTILGGLSAMPEVGRYDLSSLKAIWYGSAPITSAVLERSIAAFPASGFYQWYGQTETGMVSVLRPEDHLSRSQFTGRETFNSEIRIIDDAGREVAPGGFGEVLCTAADGMIGYFNNPEATAKTVVDGWIHTGDIARVEAEGYFTIIDRSRDMIISGAENIYPKEIENVIAGHPAVLEVAVFGIPDEKWGEAICAAIVLRPGANATAEAVVAYCAERVARYKKPGRVVFLESLPKNSMGKVTKTALRDPYWAGRSRRI